MFSQCSRLRHCDGSIVPQIIWHHCTTTSKVTSNRSSPRINATNGHLTTQSIDHTNILDTYPGKREQNA